MLFTTNGGRGTSVSITQTGSISTVDGETYKAGNTALNNQKDINLIVIKFNVFFTQSSWNGNKHSL